MVWKEVVETNMKQCDAIMRSRSYRRNATESHIVENSSGLEHLIKTPPIAPIVKAHEATVDRANALHFPHAASQMIPVLLTHLVRLLAADSATLTLAHLTLGERSITVIGDRLQPTIEPEVLNLATADAPEVVADQSPEFSLSVPLIADDQEIGSIDIKRSSPFQSHETQLLTLVAVLAAGMLCHAHVAETLE